MRSYFLLVALCVGLAVAGCSRTKSGETAQTLRFSAIPDQNTTELIQRFGPLADYLSTTLGVPVQYVPARDYQASVEMFRNSEIQLAWFGGLTGVQARAAVAGARAIAQGQADPTYYSYFIANQSSGLRRQKSFPVAIADHSFTFGSESSTSGRLMPEYFIKKNTGLTPDAFFQQPFGFSGSHDRTCALVAAGRFEVGVVNYKVYDQWAAQGKLDTNQCRIIWQTPVFADYNFTAHPALEKMFGGGFTERLQKALLAIDDPALLAALPREKLIAATDADYARIAAVARDLGMVR